MEHLDQMRKDDDEVTDKIKFYDSIFENNMNHLVNDVNLSYEHMRFRDVVKLGFFEFQHTFNAYKLHLKGSSMKKSLIEKFVLYTLMMLYPIAPHFSEITYQN